MTRALIFTSSVSCASRQTIAVTLVPKKSRKSERSVGDGEKESDGRDNALNAGDRRRHNAHLMPPAAGPGVVVVVEGEADIVLHTSAPLPEIRLRKLLVERANLERQILQRFRR